MTERYDAGPFVPPHADLDALQRAAAGCQGCPLYKNAEQTVFGAGDPHARVLLLGEQPGDQEDRQGAPFVGPAGRLLDLALIEAGIERADAYLTNAVKHFKFTREERGKRRIHEPPSAIEVKACRPWLAAELRLVDPEVIVALGAIAGKVVLGSSFRVTKQRGQPLPCPPPDMLGSPATEDGNSCRIVATVHPSSVLRAPDRDAAYSGLLADLRVVAELLQKRP